MYITAAEYATITGHASTEATEARRKRASLMLDARIGYYDRNSDGYKLDLDGLTNYQKDIVQDWVAWMVVFLTDNNDMSPSAASVSLGRFSVTEHGQQGNPIPEQMSLSDQMLESSGLVNRAAVLKHREVSYDEIDDESEV
jgi:hypothetical protein